MGKRYVFWRMPTGKPYNGEDDKHAPTSLLAKIGKAATVNAEGNISFPFPPVHLHDRLAVRTAAVVIGPDGDELNNVDASSIVSTAINSEIKKAGGGKAISPKELLLCADGIAASHFRKPVVEYVLVTTLSIQDLPANLIKVNECVISAIAGRGSRYLLPDALRPRLNDRPQGKHLLTTKYRTIKIRTSGRSVFEATDKALDAMNVLRGLWTLFATFGSWRLQLGGMPKREPIGIIRTGPIHTLHCVDGKPATDIYWYEPDYSEDGKLFIPKDGWKRIEYNRRRAMRWIKHYAYRRDLEDLILRYVRAIDNVDLSVAFLQMWSLLEKITDTVGANYDETVRRATWILPDRATAKELLEHLRLRRNQYVHAAKSGEDCDQVAYMIKSFVEPHLLALIRNDFGVTSLSEYADFLRLPTNIDTLKKRRAQLQRAVRFWK